MNATRVNDEGPPQPEAKAREGESSAQPIRFAGTLLVEKPHICAFFSSKDEEYRLMLPFIKEGFGRGEKAFHVISPKLRADHKQQMESVGIDVDSAVESGQYELCDWDGTYFRDGHFDQDRMLAMWQEVFARAAHDGFPCTRLFAKMDWSLEDREGVSNLLEYEARFNQIQTDRDPVICAYDLAKFPGDIIIDVMRTHPLIIIGGILQENPFFIPPEEFLQELRARRAAQSKPASGAG